MTTTSHTPTLDALTATPPACRQPAHAWIPADVTYLGSLLTVKCCWCLHTRLADDTEIRFYHLGTAYAVDHPQLASERARATARLAASNHSGILV